MQNTPEFRLGAIWALRQIIKKLPLSGKTCDCSADVVFYVDKIMLSLRKGEVK
jgi:hypothetical protein